MWFFFRRRLGNLYLFVGWWDKKYPRPPLGIITGELLKRFERYSPEENQSEKVLAETFGPDVEPQTPCITPGCQWLEREIYGTGVGRNSAACDNFYTHVCGGRTDIPVSLYQRATEDLMVAVADHLLTAASHQHSDNGTAEHIRILRRCVDAEEEAMEFAVACDFRSWSSVSDVPCPDHYPLVPRTVAEIIFKSDSATRAEELVSRIERSLHEMNVSATLEREGRKRPRVMTTENIRAVCRWLADSARCHLRELFRDDSVDKDVTGRYQRLWNELFFAPLSLSQEVIVLWELLGGGDALRKRACAQIHEALFKAESAEAATAVLDDLTAGVRETIADIMENAQYMLSQRVPYWLYRHEEGEGVHVQEKRRPAYLAELNAVGVELAEVAEASSGDYNTSMYSWKVSYDRARNVVTVPHGLMALTTEGMDVTEPVAAVLLSAQLVRALLPRPTGPYSWKNADDQHLAYVKECFCSVHNATLDVNAYEALLTELVYASALLGPMFDLYRNALIEGFDSNVYISQNYKNWQLFYVIWTMSHCGDPRGGDIVNAVLRTSVRFVRSFDCGMKDAMF